VEREEYWVDYVPFFGDGISGAWTAMERTMKFKGFRLWEAQIRREYRRAKQDWVDELHHVANSRN
jgi:hypothetical protein